MRAAVIPYAIWNLTTGNLVGTYPSWAKAKAALSKIRAADPTGEYCAVPA